MPDDLVTPDNLSKELLHSIFDAAFMETSWDSDGDLAVIDGIRCLVLLPSASNDLIRLVSVFGFEETSTQAQRLECVNNINQRYVLVRAAVDNGGHLYFDHYMDVRGGIAKKSIVLTTKRFLSIPLDAMADHCENLVM